MNIRDPVRAKGSPESCHAHYPSPNGFHSWKEGDRPGVQAQGESRLRMVQQKRMKIFASLRTRGLAMLEALLSPLEEADTDVCCNSEA